MSNAITYALARICGRGSIEIPRRILETAFRDEWLDTRAPISLESRIQSWVIQDRVIPDMDIAHGEELLVNLAGLFPAIQDDYAMVYTIPPELTQNREIMSVLSVSYVGYNQGNSFMGGSALALAPMLNNDITGAANQVMSSVGSIPNIQTARVDLVGTNMVRITDRRRFQQAYVLRCYVVNDHYLENIDPRNYISFTKMVILAIKAWIYNKMIMEMGDHYLQRGQQLGVFKDIIDKWETAAEEYTTFLEGDWAAISMMSDPDAHYRYLFDQVPLGL
jgi:hypothetical protein